MDGVAIYLPAGIIWLAYQAGMSLSFVQVVILAIISTLASAGASPTPGLISTLILCWGSVFPGVPIPEQVAYLAAIDWFLDRCITTVNITGDSFVTKIVDHSIQGGYQKGETNSRDSQAPVLHAQLDANDTEFSSSSSGSPAVGQRVQAEP